MFTKSECFSNSFTISSLFIRNPLLCLSNIVYAMRQIQLY
ncbi:hypothetical protein BN128_3 [Cronobacter sakazakii 696]|nr:hypothetical protein BN128_3 [Cronobacter sakazakii 696]